MVQEDSKVETQFVFLRNFSKSFSRVFFCETPNGEAKPGHQKAIEGALDRCDQRGEAPTIAR